MSLLIALVAVLAFLVLTVLSAVRLVRYPKAVDEDLRHPVRHPFLAAIPVAMLLLSTAAHALLGAAGWITALWMVAAALQFAATLWVLARWLTPGGFAWASMTPVLFIPVVGNVLAPLAGVSMGLSQWAAAQFAIGLIMWPVVLAMLVMRIGLQGLWPDRLLPTTFITVAPPAVIGMGMLQLGAPDLWAWACWGIAVFFLAWAATTARRVAGLPFQLPFWGLSFPLATFAALTLSIAASAGGAFRLLALIVLALVSLVIAGLVLATLRGLWRGTLLVPEPVAAPAATASAPA